ncbi:sigma-70 family RNA polymerase sigma factor [Hyphomonas sp.]|uniref:RNA polymerase sigma factor n=1 Tax=Hyphomonas sp. TaxID=87 RepID=UPI0030F85EFA
MPLDAIVNEAVLVKFADRQNRRDLRSERVLDGHVKKAVPNDCGRLLDLQREHGLVIAKALVHRFGAPPPDPEDAVQSAMLKFLELEGAETVRNVRAFLFAMARNIMLDEIRRMKVREKFRTSALRIATVPEFEESTPEVILINRQRYALLNEAIAALPEEARQLIVLSRIENISYADISKRTGLSAAYISRSIQRSLGQLLERLQQEGIESV